MNPYDKVNLVKAEIEKLPGKKSRGASYTMICCPFHNDSSPSGRVSHDLSTPQFIGGFRCYACGEPMKWDVFATQTNLQPFTQVDELKVPDTPVDYLDETLIGDTDSSKFIQERLTMYPLDINAVRKLGLEGPTWRGFKFSFLRSLGGEVAELTKKGHTNYYVYLPAMIHGKLRGYIKALPNKVDGLPSYFNAPGGWSKKYGLWPFDHVNNMLKEHGLATVVLVEGPRDAMRLVRAGIPALCILGTQSWSSHKILLLETLGITRVILFMDWDDAGRTAVNLLYTGVTNTVTKGKVRIAPPLHETFDVENFSLGDYLDEAEKSDPYEAPAKAIKDLAANLS